MIVHNPIALALKLILFTCLALAIVNTLFFLNKLKPTLNDLQQWATFVTRAEGQKSDIFNRTLGFEKVLAVGLPERSDKRDVLSLMASLTGFEFRWVDGVLASSIPEKAIPAGWDHERYPDTNLGSWRGHVNAIRTVVEEDLSSALILEDDVDWDVHLKPQLAQFAQAARALQLQQNADVEHRKDPALQEQEDQLSVPGHSPYGRSWDLLWLGACVTRFSDARNELKVLIRDDPTVAPRGHLVQNGTFGWDEFPEGTRIAYVPAGDTICTFAYALSRAGARKALQYLGIDEQPTTFDFHMSDLCRERHLGMRCVGLVPGLFMHHRPKGRIIADSDILEKEGDAMEQVREVGFTDNILYSTRLNLQNLVQGLEPRKQWED